LGTLNNYTEQEYEDCLDAAPNWDASFVVVGKEVAPTTNTEHLQMFFYFPGKKSLRQLKEYNGRIHWEIARGTVEQNIEYCTKDGRFDMAGEPPASQEEKGNSGKRNWEQARAAAIGGNIDDVEDAGIYVQCYGSLKRIKEDHMAAPSDIDELVNEWRYGCSGVGKSRGARLDNPVHYVKRLDKWWCGYAGQDVVIIDDMSPTHSNLADMLKIWGDHYAFPAEIKGGNMVIRPKKIIITSQYSIDEIWNDDQTKTALKRRFKERLIE